MKLLFLLLTALVPAPASASPCKPEFAEIQKIEAECARKKCDASAPNPGLDAAKKVFMTCAWKACSKHNMQAALLAVQLGDCPKTKGCDSAKLENAQAEAKKELASCVANAGT